MKVISYYELLKMIKDGNIPKKVNYKITGYLEEYVEYTAQYDRNEFTHYELTNHHREDENIHFYLNENYLESDMYDDSILILEEENKKCTVETCCIGIEGLSKALLKIKDDMKRIYENIDKVETLEEEKKIPEKLEGIDSLFKVEQDLDLKGFLAWQKVNNKVIENKINAIIDYLQYLKSKGE